MTANSPPRPGPLLIAVSWFVFLEAAGWFSLGTAALYESVMTRHIASVVTGSVLLVVATGFILLQFIALYRGHRGAARLMALLMGGLGTVRAILGLILIPAIGMAYAEIDRGAFFGLLAIAASSAIPFSAMLMNTLWASRLKEAHAPHLTWRRVVQFSLSELLSLMLLASLIAEITSAILRLDPRTVIVY